MEAKMKAQVANLHSMDDDGGSGGTPPPSPLPPTTPPSAICQALFARHPPGNTHLQPFRVDKWDDEE